MVHIHSSSWFRLYLTFERLARHGTCYGKPMSGPQHTSQCQCCRTASSWRPNRPRACGPMSFAASCPCLMNRLAPGIWLWLKCLASPESFRSCGSLMISDVGVHCMYVSYFYIDKPICYGGRQTWHDTQDFQTNPHINGHFRNLNWRYLPYIRPM